MQAIGVSTPVVTHADIDYVNPRKAETTSTAPLFLTTLQLYDILLPQTNSYNTTGLLRSRCRKVKVLAVVYRALQIPS